MKVKVTGIKWGADDMEDVQDISTEMVLNIPEEVFHERDFDQALSDFIEDEISNQSGFTHLGWESHEVLKTQKQKG